MNKGIEVLFKYSGDRLRHIKKLDISSNLIQGEEGGAIIAQSLSFPNLYSMDLRLNKLGNEGFKVLVQSKNYPNLTDLKMDRNRLEDTGAQ
jgi:Ran GTPase-activating protein (RanGAP) involved in mRNA processing and transport